ncbi:MAG: sulfurtransferase TusA family protein [Oscillatoriales cyanobacterium SM2_1_8]|nr:sulfurtransferase TusA family protein [Oscillatoriales cyanobacterium SM2_1_8]
MNTAENPDLDLRGVPCPLSFVKAKLYLEQVPAGQVVAMWVDLGEPLEQVPHSLRTDGYTVARSRRQVMGC